MTPSFQGQHALENLPNVNGKAPEAITTLWLGSGCCQFTLSELFNPCWSRKFNIRSAREHLN